ncbi:MAG: YaiI/YqxD family protein [Bacillota bacterium]|nr:YaiI/YqxD family protein [Bacillota bacterium]
MRIIVDGDACPGKELIEMAAKEYNIEVIIYCNINHAIKSNYSRVIQVDSGFQSVDMKVANEAKANDIVVTQDYGVAAMVLGKKCFAISPKGNIYDNENIDRLLFERHISQKVRRGGGRTSNPKKRNEDDNKRLYNNLKKLIIKLASL